MYRKSFGNRGQVKCPTPESYYELLGYLAKSDGTTKLVWENNELQGAWGSEGRIQFFNYHVPVSAILAHTAGVGNVKSRVNCNDFVEHIATKHGFVQGWIQNVSYIRTTIPATYIPDFERGLTL